MLALASVCLFPLLVRADEVSDAIIEVRNLITGWIPYAITAIVAVIVAALALWAIPVLVRKIKAGFSR